MNNFQLNKLMYFTDNCPVSATKSKKIGTKCYILGPSQVKLDDAQQYCSDQCGTLAEPDLTQSDIQAFSNKFHTQFVDEIATSNTYNFSYKIKRIRIKIYRRL